MMKNIDPTGGPAFPGTENWSCRGMTLFDFYAAAALQGLIAGNQDLDLCAKTAAKYAAECADMMLEERKRWIPKSMLEEVPGWVDSDDYELPSH
jgi:hypothetical protein